MGPEAPGDRVDQHHLGDGEVRVCCSVGAWAPVLVGQNVWWGARHLYFVVF